MVASVREIVDIYVRQTGDGLTKTQQGLTAIQRQARTTRALVREIFAIASTGFLIRQIAQLADVFRHAQNRLRVTIESQERAISQFDRLGATARRTRADLRGTIELYSRLAIASRGTGRSMSELTQVVESVNKAIILSGASGREANAGLIQLSQGIASGVIRGDELRSVLEQLPVVADVLAKQLKTTRGDLREFGRQ